MKNSIFIIVMIFVINFGLHSQSKIDYSPKSLKHEIEKILDSKNFKLTEIKLEPNFAKEITKGKFFRIETPNPFIPVMFAYVGRVKTCRGGGCSIDSATSPDDDSEFYDYFMILTSDAVVLIVKIYNFQSSHGQEITSHNWLKQFTNYNGDKELIVGKNIDAIAGATISVEATTSEIEHKVNVLKSILK